MQRSSTRTSRLLLLLFALIAGLVGAPAHAAPLPAAASGASVVVSVQPAAYATCGAGTLMQQLAVERKSTTIVSLPGGGAAVIPAWLASWWGLGSVTYGETHRTCRNFAGQIIHKVEPWRVVKPGHTVAPTIVRTDITWQNGRTASRWGTAIYVPRWSTTGSWVTGVVVRAPNGRTVNSRVIYLGFG